MSQPLVSVIIPTYNHQRYIIECVDSVLNQTFTNTQIIIINDGSKDDTDRIIKDFLVQKQHLNIEYYSKANEGLCKTINFGLTKSKGDYVAVLASDDIWQKNKLEKQIDFLEKNSMIGLVYSDAFIIKGVTKTDIKYSDYKPKLNYYFKNSIQNIDIYKSLLTENFVLATTVVLRKSVIEDIGFFDESIPIEDFDMWLRISKKYPFGYIDLPLAYYRVHDTNMSNNTMLMIKGTAKTISKHLKNEPYKGKIFKSLFVLIRFYLTALKNRIKKHKKFKR